MSSNDTLNRTTCRATLPTLRRRALLGALGLTFALAAVLPSAANAVNSFTLDTSPDASSAAIAVDGAGTGYFAWRHPQSSADVAMFCKVVRGGTCTNPIVLPAAPTGFGGVTTVDAPFPVLGSGSTVYVVGPRFAGHDVVLWTSTDGGVTFGSPTATTDSGTSEGSNPTDVLAAPSGGFYISSHNPGLAFTSVPASGTGIAPVTDLSPPGGTANAIGDSSLGLAGGGTTGNPVEAWSMFTGGSPFTVNFRSATGDPNTAANWSPTSQVSTGKLSSLAGGPSGLFLVSEDIDAAGHYSQVNVRKYTPGSFGMPIETLQADTSYDNSGRIFQTPGGRVLVVWQGPPRSDGGVAIRLYDSTTNPGAPFTRVGDVAEGTPNGAIGEFRLAAADDGQGFVSFKEVAGPLRVADLSPIKSSTTTVTELSTAGQAAGAKLTVGPGTPVTDTATVQGPGGAAAIAAGAGVRFAVYSDAACTQQGRIFATVGLTGGTATSTPISLPIGTWYLQAHYGGNTANAASTSECGTEVVTVNPASATVAGIIFVGGQILINTGFNTPGTVLVTTQITNALQVLIPPGPPGRAARASAARKANRCKSGQALLTVGHKRKCVSNSFGTTTKTIPAPGAYKIMLAPNAAARRALARGKTLHVKVTVTFKPISGGKPVITNTKITIKGHKASKR